MTERQRQWQALNVFATKVYENLKQYAVYLQSIVLPPSLHYLVEEGPESLKSLQTGVTWIETTIGIAQR